MNTAPTVGTYLIPIQRFRVCYALQVLGVVNCDDTHAPGIKQIHCKRWGLNDQRQPFDDGHTGHSNDGWYTGYFRPVGTSAWRVWDHPVNWHEQIYFKQIPAPIVAGQLVLF